MPREPRPDPSRTVAEADRDASRSRTRLRSHALAAVVLGIAAALAYWTSFEAGLIVDSGAIIREAARVHEATWANVADILSTDYWSPTSAMGEYRPLTTLTYLVNWAVLGNADRPAGYHAVNLAIHFGNALLLYALGVAALGLGATTAFFAALLFVTHPVATEAVTNVVGRADLLAAASVLACLLLQAAARRAAGRRRVALSCALAATAFLGFLSKESSVVLVPALLLFELVYALPARERARSSDVVAALARFARTSGVALAAPLAGTWLVRSWVFARTPPVRLGLSRAWLLGDDPWTASLTGLKSFGRALWVLVWPRTLCPDYGADLIPRFGWSLARWEDWQAVVSGVALALACALTIVLRRRERAAAFFCGFFLCALLPVLVLHVIVGGVVAERLLYLPLAGFAGGAVLAVEALARRLDRARSRATRADELRRDPRATAWALLAIVAVAYAARTADRNRDWQSALTLFTDAVAACGGSYKSHHALAGAVAQALAAGDAGWGTLDRVIELEDTAVAILARTAPAGEPLPPDVLEAQGAAYLSKALVEADRERAAGGASHTASRGWASKAASALGAATAQVEAENRARRARSDGNGVREVGTAQLYNDLGLALLQSGSPDRALGAFARARDLAPLDTEAYLHLAEASAALGRSQDVLSSLVEAAVLAPGRDDLRAAAYGVYRELEPDGCAFAADGQRARFDLACPAGRRLACDAVSAVADRVLSAPAGAPAESADATSRWRDDAARRYGCSALGS
ncbi:MAG TPA: hypothetical protein VFD92_18420 [Candidatus Binatia bacterium]|nr:hypothetical protein [Candidatus Binatia bacterium]